jgi:hypothetical protein
VELAEVEVERLAVSADLSVIAHRATTEALAKAGSPRRWIEFAGKQRVEDNAFHLRLHGYDCAALPSLA